MSWWVYLEDDKGELVQVARHNEGATQCVHLDGTEGTEEAECNVTYNYNKHFAFGENLPGKKASKTIKMLQDAVDKFGIARANDYWEATEGNVGYACSILLGWAQQHPDARWRVS